LGHAAIVSLPGRWKLQSWQPFGKPAAMPHQAPSQVDYIDVTNDSIQVHSQFVREAWSFFIFDGLRPGDKRTDIDPEVVTFSFQFPMEPPQNRGPKWIDLYVKNGPANANANANRLVARGVFMADDKLFSIRLVPANMPRPTNWNPTTSGDKSISLSFQRADDLTLMQGRWKIKKCDVKVADGNVVYLIITKDQLRLEAHGGIEGFTRWTRDLNGFMIQIETECQPKRLILTGQHRDGVIRVIEGVYKFDGDKLSLSFEAGGQILLNVDAEAEKASVTYELERTTP
jgi:hypothetical protein